MKACLRISLLEMLMIWYKQKIAFQLLYKFVKLSKMYDDGLKIAMAPLSLISVASILETIEISYPTLDTLSNWRQRAFSKVEYRHICLRIVQV